MSDLASRQFQGAVLAIAVIASSFVVRPRTISAQAPFLVKDINATPIVQSSDPKSFVTIGAQTFFAAFSPSAGRELWKTDGTPAGTVLVKDINPGLTGSSPTELIEFDGALFFRAEGAAGGLWRSDGTEAGTSRIATLATESLTVAGSTLYFSGSDNAGRELWKSDGTSAGTMRVKDINPGFAESHPRNMVDFGGTLFFQATTAATGTELWKSDGSEAGTVLVKDILYPGSSEPFALRVVGGTLFFSATDGSTGRELWKTDGSELGTQLVLDINPGTASAGPLRLTEFGGLLFFIADDGVNGSELWSSDGSAAGTMLVKDIHPGPGSSNADRFTVIGSTLYFNADDGSTGTELWKSDGSEAGSAIVLDINPGTDASFPDALTDVNGLLLFRAFTPANGQELWRSDGTAIGTALVAEICAGTCTGVPFSFPFPTHLNGTLLFLATDGTSGNELWASDGTGPGTQLLKNIAPDDSTPDGLDLGSELVDLSGTLIFTATDGLDGVELWTSDGTEAGTTLVEDINPGPGDAFANPGDLTRAGARVFFAADDGASGTELWLSDGSAAGTFLVEDIRPGPGDALNAVIPLPFPITIINPPYMAELDGSVLFNATAGGSAWSLWHSDGTAVGTFPVTDEGNNPAGMTNVGGVVYFQGASVPFDVELWRSDGTEPGTFPVADINSGGSSSPDLFTDIFGELFFRADGADGTELWRSDGTAPGTLQVADVNPGPSPGLSSAGEIVAVGGIAFFAGTDFSIASGTGNELWRTDGTEAGTSLVKDIWPGTSGSFPHSLIAFKGKLYFAASGGLPGGALWVSDGTEGGTVEVIDIDPAFSSGPYNFVSVDGRLIFVACDAEAGCEPWESDGTAAGTQRIADIMPGPTGSNPGPFVRSGDYLFFPATVSGNSSTGRELWALPVLIPGPCGDGVVNTGEVCDDGNTTGGDCCAADCSAATSSGAACDDGVSCTTGDACDGSGACIGAAENALCDDGNACTFDFCNIAAGCLHDAGPAAMPCDDGVSCTTGDVCDANGGCDGVAEDALCEDGNVCTANTCDAEMGCQVANEPPTTPCDDGVGCTENDACDGNGDCAGVADDSLCDDGNLCTIDVCDLSSGCESADRPPSTTCRTAERSALRITHDPADQTRDRLIWRWRKGESTMPAELGDPTAATNYALCVYDGNGLALSANVSAGAGWETSGDDGFKYSAAAGLQVLRLKASAESRSRALLRGKGAALPDPSLPFLPPVTVQLINDTTPLCLESVFEAGQVNTSDDTRFRANDP